MPIESAVANPLAPYWFTNKNENSKKDIVAINLLTAWCCNKPLNNSNWRIQKVAKYIQYPAKRINIG